MNLQLPKQFSQPLASSAARIESTQICQLAEGLKAWLVEIFKDEDVTDLVQLRAQFVDLVLRKLWTQHKLDEYQITLIAVGGYGRGELHPYSDVDILLLTKPEIDEKLSERIGAFITQMWDIRFEVGHSVRSVEQCLEQARNDVTIATNLLESRLICGNEQLLQQLELGLQDDQTWTSSTFFMAKMQEQQARHQQFLGAAYTLEPNLKANPGALRDIQTIAWVAKKHFQANNLEELVAHRYLTANEYTELQECQNYLWRMRFALHNIANRNENRLLFDYQSAVAKLMGFGDEGKVAVESMMLRFFSVINRISELNEMLLQHFHQAILGNENDAKIEPLNRDFQKIGHFIQVTHNRVMLRPETIMRLFLTIADNPDITGIHANTIRLLRNARRRLISGLQDYAECRQLFIQLIKHPKGLGTAFSLMHKHDVLGSYLPEWRAITGQMQFDLFHAYSVDEHSYRLIKNLYRFSKPEYSNEYPLCSKIMQRIRKPEVLYLAGIFHDIAKGRGGDHAKLGAVDALRFCQSHKLSDHDGRMISWLVLNHLLMSVTAQRQDISDENVITRFAQVVRDEAHLDYLYCLTVADMRATNESLWNSWKANLLEELYFSTKRALRRGIEKPVDLRAKIRENEQDALALLAEFDIDKDAVATLWHQFKADYFLRYSPAQIAWHTRHILAHDKTSPLVLISDKPYRGGTEIFIYAKEVDYIFATIVASLSAKNLSILDAKIITSKDGYTANTFAVLDERDKPITEQRRLADIAESVKKALNNPEQITIINAPVPQRFRQFKINTQVSFIDSNNKNRSVIELVALDRPGLLASIASVFQQCNVSIHSAKITTFGERAEDIFTISTQQHTALSADEQAELCEKLCSHIE